MSKRKPGSTLRGRGKEPTQITAQQARTNAAQQAAEAQLEKKLKELEKAAATAADIYRGARALKLTLGQISARYGVSRQRVLNACNGQKWLDEHNSKRVFNRAKAGSKTSTCRACFNQGHNARNPKCPAKNPPP